MSSLVIWFSTKLTNFVPFDCESLSSLQECGDQQKAIHKLETEKCYLGERLYKVTGVEEAFWSDTRLVSRLVEMQKTQSCLGCETLKMCEVCWGVPQY